jgi:hypothetical protein
LPCVFPRRTAKKTTNGTGAKRRGTPFAVRREKTHGKHELFAVRLPEKRTANMGCLPCASLKTHDKHGSLPCACLENARQ